MQTRRLQVWDDSKKIVALSLRLLPFFLLPAAAIAGPPPVITAQPLDQGVALGGTATFTVTATSGTALSYQWYKDGLLDLDTALPGQTSSTLTINNVGLLDPGTFYVAVKNASGTTYSRHASLSLVLLNNPPVGNNDTYTTLEDTALNITGSGVLANDTDADNNALSAVLVSGVTHGNLTLSANGQFLYVPNTNYYGSDSFTYKPHDGSVAGNTVTVTINVTSVNDPPLARNDSYTLAEDTTLTVSVAEPHSAGNGGVGVLSNDVDVDSDTLSAVLVTDVSHGSLVFNANGTFVYTPHPDYYGSDSFTYRASDGFAMGNVTTVSLTITPVADPATITAQRMTPAGFELEISRKDAAPCVILASTNLQDWTPIFTNAVSAETFIFTDSTAGNFSSRFYRVESR